MYFFLLYQILVGPTIHKTQLSPWSPFILLINSTNFDTPSKELHNPPDPRMQIELDRSEFRIKAKKAKWRPALICTYAFLNLGVIKFAWSM